MKFKVGQEVLYNGIDFCEIAEVFADCYLYSIKLKDQYLLAFPEELSIKIEEAE